MRVKESLVTKTVSLVIACIFTFTSVTEGAPIAIEAVSVQTADKISLSSLAHQIDIPTSLGSIQKRYAAETSSSLDRPAQHASTIIHIQDAHASLDAQRSVHEILNHLNSNYDVDLIFLEGAMNTLSGSLLQFFEEDELNRQLAQLLLKDGIVGGTELFLLEETLKQNEAVQAFGVEDPAIYAQNLKDFRAVYQAKETSEEFLNELKSQILTLGSHVFNKDLKEFFRKWLFYQDAPRELMRQFETLKRYALSELGRDLLNAREQIEWPQMVRFFKLQSLEKKQNKRKARKQFNQLKKSLDTAGVSQRLGDSLSLLNPSRKGGLDPSKSIRRVVEQLVDLLPDTGIDLTNHEALMNHWGSQILQEEIQATLLIEEANQITDLILGKMAVSEEEKELITLYKDYLLLQKLFSLELVHEDYQSLLRKEEAVRPETVNRRVQDLHHRVSKARVSLKGGQDQSPISRQTPDLPFDQALAFYEGARVREEVIFQNMVSQMEDLGKTKAVLITGGFHANGLQDQFRSNQLSYVEVMPKILNLSEESNYIDVMTLQGNYTTRRSYVNHPSAADEGVITVMQQLPEDAVYMAGTIHVGLSSIVAQEGIDLEDAITQINVSPAGLQHAQSGNFYHPESGILVVLGGPLVVDPENELALAITRKGPGLAPAAEYLDTLPDVTTVIRSEARAADQKMPLPKLIFGGSLVAAVLASGPITVIVSNYLEKANEVQTATSLTEEQEKALFDNFKGDVQKLVKSYIEAETKQQGDLDTQVNYLLERREAFAELERRGITAADFPELGIENLSEIEDLNTIYDKIIEYDTQQVIIESAVKRAKESGIEGQDLEDIRRDPSQLPSVLTKREELLERARKLGVPELVKGTHEEIEGALDKLVEDREKLKDADGILFGTDRNGLDATNVTVRVEAVKAARDALEAALRAAGVTDSERIKEELEGKTRVQLELRLEFVKAFGAQKLVTMEDVPDRDVVAFLKDLEDAQRANQARQIMLSDPGTEKLRTQLAEIEINFKHYQLEDLPEEMQAEYKLLEPTLETILTKLGQQALNDEDEGYDPKYPSAVDWYAGFFKRVLAIKGYAGSSALSFLRSMAGHIDLELDSKLMRPYREFLVANAWDTPLQADGSRVDSQEVWIRLNQKFNKMLRAEKHPEKKLAFTMGHALEHAERDMQRPKVKILRLLRVLLPPFNENIEQELFKRVLDPDFKPDFSDQSLNSTYNLLRFFLYRSQGGRYSLPSEPLYFHDLTNTPYGERELQDTTYELDQTDQMVTSVLPSRIYFPSRIGSPFRSEAEFEDWRVRGIGGVKFPINTILWDYKLGIQANQKNIFATELKVFIAENPVFWTGDRWTPPETFDFDISQKLFEDYVTIMEAREEDGTRKIYNFLEGDYSDWFFRKFTEIHWTGTAGQQVQWIHPNRELVRGEDLIDELADVLTEMQQPDSEGFNQFNRLPVDFQVTLKILLAKYREVKAQYEKEKTRENKSDLDVIRAELYSWSAEMARNAITKVPFAMLADAAKRGESVEHVLRKMDYMLAIRDGVEYFFDGPIRLHDSDEIGRWTTLANQGMELGVSPELFKSMLVLMKTDEVQNYTKALMSEITTQKIETIDVKSELLGPLHTSYLQFIALNIQSQKDFDAWFEIFSDKETKYNVEVSRAHEGRIVVDANGQPLRETKELTLRELLIEFGGRARVTHTDGKFSSFTPEDVATMEPDDDFLSYIIPEAEGVLRDVRQTVNQLSELSEEDRRTLVNTWVRKRDTSILTQQRSSKLTISESEARSEARATTRQMIVATAVSALLAGGGSTALHLYLNPHLATTDPDQTVVEQLEIFEKAQQELIQKVKELETQLADSEMQDRYEHFANHRDLVNEALRLGIPEEDVLGEESDKINEMIEAVIHRNDLIATALKRAKEAGIKAQEDLAFISQNPEQLPSYLTRVEKLENSARTLKIDLATLTGTLDQMEVELEARKARHDLIKSTEGVLIGVDRTGIETWDEDAIRTNVQQVLDAREALAEELRRHGATDSQEIQRATEGKTYQELVAALELAKSFGLDLPPDLDDIQGGIVAYAEGIEDLAERVKILRHILQHDRERDRLDVQIPRIEFHVRVVDPSDFSPEVADAYYPIQPLIAKINQKLGIQAVDPGEEGFDPQYPSVAYWYEVFWMRIFKAQGIPLEYGKQWLETFVDELQLGVEPKGFRDHREYFVINYFDEMNEEGTQLQTESLEMWRRIEKQFHAMLREQKLPIKSLAFTIGHALERTKFELSVAQGEVDPRFGKSQLEQDLKNLEKLLPEGQVAANRKGRFFVADPFENSLMEIAQKLAADPSYRPDVKSHQKGDLFYQIRSMVYPHMGYLVGSEGEFYRGVGTSPQHAEAELVDLSDGALFRSFFFPQKGSPTAYLADIALSVHPFSPGRNTNPIIDPRVEGLGPWKEQSLRILNTETSQAELFANDLRINILENPVFWSLAGEVFEGDVAFQLPKNYRKVMDARDEYGNRLIYQLALDQYGDFFLGTVDGDWTNFTEFHVTGKSRTILHYSSSQVPTLNPWVYEFVERVPFELEQTLKPDYRGKIKFLNFPPDFQGLLLALLEKNTEFTSVPAYKSGLQKLGTLGKFSDMSFFEKNLSQEEQDAVSQVVKLQFELYVWTAQLMRNYITKVPLAMLADAAKKGQTPEQVIEKIKVMLAIKDGVEHFFGRQMKIHDKYDVGRWSTMAEQVMKLGVRPELFNTLLVLAKSEEVQKQTLALTNAVTGQEVKELDIESEDIGPLHVSYLQWVAKQIQSQEDFERWMSVFTDKETKHEVDIAKVENGRVVLDDNGNVVRETVTKTLRELLIEFGSRGRVTHTDGQDPDFTSEDLLIMTSTDDYLAYVIPEAEGILLEIEKLERNQPDLSGEDKVAALKLIVENWARGRDTSIVAQQRSAGLTVTQPRSEARIALPPDDEDDLTNYLNNYGSTQDAVVFTSRNVAQQTVSEDHRVNPVIFQALVDLVAPVIAKKEQKSVEEVRAELAQSFKEMQLIIGNNTLNVSSGGVVVISSTSVLSQESVAPLFASYLLELAGVNPEREVIVAGKNVGPIKNAILSKDNELLSALQRNGINSVLKFKPAHHKLDQAIQETVKKEALRRAVASQTTTQDTSELEATLNEVLNFIDDGVGTSRMSAVEKAEALFVRTMVILDAITSLDTPIDAKQLKDPKTRDQVLTVLKAALIKRLPAIQKEIIISDKGIVLTLNNLSIQIKAWKAVAKAA